MSDTVHFHCPHCQVRFKAPAEYVGRRFDCPKCRQSVTVPKPAATPAAGPPAQPAGSAEWDELVAYLRSGKPADIDLIGDRGVTANVTRYFETVAADPSCPKLTYYLLAAADAAVHPPFLVVKTGEQAEHDHTWNFNFKPLLQRAHPGFTWDDLYRNSAGTHSNHSKPGCHLATTAPFDGFVRKIADRKYRLEKVLRPAQTAAPAPAPKQSRRLTPDETVTELVRLIGGDGGFGNRAQIGEIGEALHAEGGMALMQQVYYKVRGRGVYFSQDIWDGIGDWRS